MKRIWRLGTYVMALLLFLAAVRSGESLKRDAGILAIFLDDPGVEAEMGEEILKRETGQDAPVSACFWAEQAVSVSCGQTGRSAAVTEVIALGNTELIRGGSNVLQWHPAGCMIDTRTAQELFGTEEAGGQRISCGNQELVVCGVFESIQKMILRLAGRGETVRFRQISLRPAGDRNRREAAAQLLMRYGLVGEIMDFYSLALLAANLCLLFPAKITMRIVSLLIRRNGKYDKMSVSEPDQAELVQSERRMAVTGRRPVILIMAAVVLISTLIGLWRLIRIPSDMIPSRWSDFAFWNSWRQEQGRILLLTLRSALGETQLRLLTGMLRTVCLALLALVR